MTAHCSRDDLLVRTVAVPGNHDCNITRPHYRADILTAHEPSELLQLATNKESEIVPEYTNVQKHFFDYLSLVKTHHKKIEQIASPSRLTYVYTFDLCDRTIQISCLNTAWVSRRDEEQSQLVFPAKRVPNRLPQVR